MLNKLSKTALRRLLEKHSVLFETWGSGSSKTFEWLHVGLWNGEHFLEEREIGLCRIVGSSAVHVCFNDNGTLYKLFKRTDLFADGGADCRIFKDGEASFDEKCLTHELPEEAVRRALKKVLGIEKRTRLSKTADINQGSVPSTSFPGLFTERRVHVFELHLPKKYYKRPGYIDVQDDRTSYFVWQKVQGDV